MPETSFYSSRLRASMSLAIADIAEAATLYVATTGSDSNAGTLASPFKTITRAADVASPGSEVIVRGGTYRGRVRVSNGGTSTAYIWLHPYGGEQAIIDGTGAGVSKWSPLVSINGSYVKFDGFEIANSGGDGLDVSSGKINVQIINNAIHDSQTQGILIGGKNNLVQGNAVYYNSKRSASGGGWDQGISVAVNVNSNITIKGNSVYFNWGEGIGAMKISSGVTISGNTVHDNQSANIYIDSAYNNKVDGNFTYSTRDQRFLSNGTPAQGIATTIETSGGKLDNNVYTNNIDVGSSQGFRWWNEAGYGGLVNNLIANNTFVNETGANIQIDSYSGNRGNTVVNNISYRSSSGRLSSGSPGSGAILGNSCWFGGSAGSFAGGGDVAADPLFLQAGAFSPDGYKLSNASPCMTSGRELKQVTSNFWGTSRAVPYSSGAY